MSLRKRVVYTRTKYVSYVFIIKGFLTKKRAISGAGTTNSSGTPEFTLGF